MAVSKAIVPLLKGKAATKIVDDFKKSKFIPATNTDRENASSAIAKFLREKNRWLIFRINVLKLDDIKE